MRKVRAAVVLAGLLGLAAGCNGAGKGIPAGVAKFQIVNGTADASHTSVGALEMSDGSLCTGTVIAPRLVVTAAHCIEGGSAQVFILGANIDSGSATQVTATKSIQHPQYQAEVVEQGEYVGYHDIAVVVLSKNAPVAPVAYRKASLSGTEGSVVTFVGYGEDKIGLRYNVRTTLDAIWTQGWWNYVSSQYPGNTCNGDSGGPGLLSVGGVEQIIGIVSSGDQYCSHDGYNTRVDTNATWLDQMVTQYGGGATATCPSGTCDNGETAATCPQDCGGTAVTCPNGTCDNGETAATCPDDCTATTGDCQTCVDGACGSQLNTCGASQACVDLYNCIGDCQDQACADACVQQSPDGVTALQALYDCVDQQCATECGGGTGTGTGDDLWTACGTNGECPTNQTCVQTDDGNHCTLECTDTDGGTGCPDGYGCFATTDGGGVCAPSGTTCGDGLCGYGETRESCAKDCFRTCGSLDDVGCCDGNVVTWCENGLLKQWDCGDTACGWSADAAYYDCTGTATPDPGGHYALSCGTLPGGEDTGPTGNDAGGGTEDAGTVADSGPVQTDLGGGTDEGPAGQDAWTGYDPGTGGEDTGWRRDTGSEASGAEGATPGGNDGTDLGIGNLRSGGGCTAGAAGGTGALLPLLAGLAGLVMRRRRS
jgi:V8-like Glu-specific endopeptidase